MNGHEKVTAYLKGIPWKLVRRIDLGMTADVFIVERGEERRALKVRREGGASGEALLVEHRVLRYLNGTPMRRYVPRVGAWLPEVDGFSMEYLRYPTREERAAEGRIPTLAHALRTLHDLELPAIEGLPDDRPDLGASVLEHFGDLFAAVLRGKDFWAGLAEADVPLLEVVRAHYPAYAALLAQAAGRMAGARAALTHGDLAGDNVMLTPEGRLALADWGTARIGAAAVDAAALPAYEGWSREERRRFYGIYLGEGDGTEAAPAHIEELSRLHRYRACVQSLLWLRGEEEGLDAVGRSYFERQLSAL